MTRLYHDHPAIHAIRAERERLMTLPRDEHNEWVSGMIQAYANVLKTLDPLTDVGGPHDDWGVGIALPVPAHAA